MGYKFPSVAGYGLERAAEVVARGFTDYLVPIVVNPSIMLQMDRVDSVDLAVSRVFVRDGTAIGAALIARRG